MEQEKQTDNITDLYSELINNEPKLITDFVPFNGPEQKQLFLTEQVRNPQHIYDKLESKNFSESIENINHIGTKILSSSSLNPKFNTVYEDFINNYDKKTRLMEQANLFNTATSSDDRKAAKERYMSINIESYGEPSESVYRSLLQEKLDQIKSFDLTGKAETIRSELFGMVTDSPEATQNKRYEPPQSTVDWMHDIAESLYGGMLQHVPDKEQFTASEIRDIFSEIIEQEFDGSAQGWDVRCDKAQSINVKSTEKLIIIPDSDRITSNNNIKKLIVHEIGVHVLRSIMGGQSDLEPLAVGLNDYGDAEEGLAVVMEQAMENKFAERGIEHYITAGLAHCDNKDFRDIFEVKWRLSALKLAAKNGDISDEDISKSKNLAYNATMRCMRGTDELPWFKDLSYYNGAVDMWRHLEEIEGNDLKFQFVFMGKANPANPSHDRAMYETKTII